MTSLVEDQPNAARLDGSRISEGASSARSKAESPWSPGRLSFGQCDVSRARSGGLRAPFRRRRFLRGRQSVSGSNGLRELYPTPDDSFPTVSLPMILRLAQAELGPDDYGLEHFCRAAASTSPKSSLRI